MTILTTGSVSSTADQRSTAATATNAPHGGTPSAWCRCADGKLPRASRDLGRAIDAQTTAQVRNRHATLLAFSPGGAP